MKIKSMQVEFDHQDRVYLVGSTLQGVVKVSFEKPTKLQTIVVYVKGKGKTSWDKDDLSHDDINYSAKEYYIDETVKLYGEDTGESVKHPQGDFSYPFSVQLGADMPCSYEGKKGYVRYCCEAVITRPWKFNETFREPFTVIRHLDCNEFADALNPIADTVDQKVEGLCCCKCSEEGSMTVKIQINKTAFVPGEPLIYEFSVDNRSQNVIKTIDFILRQNATFAGFSDRMLSSGKPHFHTKKASFKLFNEKVEIPVNQYKSFKGAATIPAIPPTGLAGCNIIDIDYNVILFVENSFTPAKFKAPVFIGTIPTTGEYQIPAPPTTDEKALSANDIGLSLQPSAPHGLPPSYAECVFGKVDLKEDDDKHTTSYTNWAPAYTYYDWSKTTNYGGLTPSTVTPAADSYNHI
ncbi:arrestin domain-containing protein 17-like [Mytilus galloprovincialis]|uniref:arrestin domain-containing protein 17-like n=1 Tax=Mytilus galloprovincialis TaxID=29158 RepID=UPI003F7C61C7